ncbi:hypothetical protein EPUS_00237 [Endocarpon pusillum Z07020]|uniref:Uncharacterized protein n=1 Tax=Endocarpon pusillum (strain Z07020 / HMAS-L-300199) TaxID=1263415 RepID=U1I0P0_ENDPU|nr:uncharacterized protein EPUS_00237 [Endocarpon pusillum Z07020]ERF75444.1 hypothetical protein EPUS_00237 [Endocarpon pusillum Z07020]
MIGGKFTDPWKVVDASDPDAELALTTGSGLRYSPNVKEFDAALVIMTERKGNVNYAPQKSVPCVSEGAGQKVDRAAVSEYVYFSAAAISKPINADKEMCGNNEGSIQYTDSINGEATDGEVFWCVD